MTGKQKLLLGSLLNSIPQVQAVNMVRAAVSPQELAQRIMIQAGIQALSDEQNQAIIELMLMDKAARTQLAGELVGVAIEQAAPGIFSRIFNALFGWLK